MNPLTIQIPSGGLVEDCPDPSVIRGQTPDDSAWYAYCTTDPLNDSDVGSDGNYNFHFIPILKSMDLIHWTYLGDAFSARPSWAASNAFLWAPDIRYFNGHYYLYYAVTGTNFAGGGSAIGVATSQSPAGPWIDSGVPVIMPEDAACCPGQRRAVIDPAILITPEGNKFIYFGSFFGGVSARKLSDDGLNSDLSSEVQITIPNRYEAAYVVLHDSFYYLFVSATSCCNGPLTGYVVFAGRSVNPGGPFVDQNGVSLLDARVGGSPVISINGNHWLGPGHNAMFTDFAGQDWFLYHAIDHDQPYFANSTITKRHLMMDALDWVNGWPTVRGGYGASDTPQPSPAAQPGQKNSYTPRFASSDIPGTQLPQFSDDFSEPALGPQWTWIRPPAPNTYGLTGQTFQMNTQPADLYLDTNNASVLVEAAPSGNYLVEARVSLNVPLAGCCQNFVQAGLVIYGDDNNYIKLVHVSIFETRQTEFAKEIFPVPSGFPRYGNTVAGPPGDWTFIRIAKHVAPQGEIYTAYTSTDGQTWTRGGTWTHNLGANAKIGLVAMGGAGFVANFDYVRVFGL